MKQERDILNVVIEGLMRSDYGKLGFSVAEKNGNFFSAADIALGNADCINRYRIVVIGLPSERLKL